VIGLLLLSQESGATQLEDFCKHFISMNYQPMRKREEWSKLTGKNLEFMETNQWPPLSYLKELKEYEKKVGTEKKVEGAASADQDDKCSIM
jgi:hypothetical protein